MRELTESDVQRMHNKWLRTDGGIEAEKCHMSERLCDLISRTRERAFEHRTAQWCDCDELLDELADELENLCSAITDLKYKLRKESDDAYCNMISIMRSDEALGWEELAAHCLAKENFGRHLALVQVCRDLDRLFNKEE